MAVEIKQALEREFEVILTAQDLRVLTFAKLQELTDSGGKSIEKVDVADNEEVQRNTLLRSMGREELADKVIVPLNESAQSKQNSDTNAIFIPGIEGVVSPVLFTLCKNVNVPIYALQLHSHCREESFTKLIELISKVSKTINFPLNSNNSCDFVS